MVALLDVDAAAIVAAQYDPAYMARVARLRHAVEDGKVWHYDEESGMTLLVPVKNMDAAA